MKHVGLMQRFRLRSLFIPHYRYAERQISCAPSLVSRHIEAILPHDVEYQDADLSRRSPCSSGSILFELCRFLYTGSVNTYALNDPQESFLALLHISEKLQVNQLFDYCMKHFQTREICSRTFFSLETMYAYDHVIDTRNRVALLALLRDAFQRHHKEFSDQEEFTFVPISTLIQLVTGGPSRPPLYIRHRWNYFLDKSLSELVELESHLDHDARGSNSCSLVDIRSGKTISTGSKQKLSSKDFEIGIEVPADSTLTWRIDGLFKGRQLGLLSSLFLLRQTHADGVYELQLQDGSANPPTAHITGSSDSIEFDVNMNSRRTSISIGHQELISTPHRFRSLDMRLVHEGRTDGDTTVFLIDIRSR